MLAISAPAKDLSKALSAVASDSMYCTKYYNLPAQDPVNGRAIEACSHVGHPPAF